MIAMVFASMPIPADEAAPMADSRAGERAVLVEAFTATNCGYCPGSDGALDRMVSNSGTWSSGYWPDRATLIQWHLRGDPYQNSDGTARASYYGVTGTPWVWFDGVYDAVGGSQSGNNTGIDSWYKGFIDQRPTTGPIDVTITYTLAQDWKSGTWNVTLSGVSAHTNTSLNVRVALVEDINITHGTALFRFTGRDMLVDQAVTTNNGDTDYVSGNFNVNSAWDETKMGFIAWVQSDDSKEVLGSAQKLFPGNTAPEPVAGNWDVTMDEDMVDETLDMDSMFTDPEGQTLTFSIESQAATSHVSAFKQAGNIVKFTPDQDWSGTEDFKITASDGSKEASQTITVTVNPVNDLPVVGKPMTDFSMNEGTSDKHIDLDTVFNDVETVDADLILDFSGNTELTVSINPSSHVVTITAPDGFAGEETIVFRATDEDSAYIEDDVKVTVKDVNYPPVLVVPMADITMDEDSTHSLYDLDDVFADSDGDTIQYSISGNSAIVVTIDVDNVVTFAPKANWNGQETIYFEASDNIGAPVADDLTVTVMPINDPPELIGDLEDIEMNEDNAFTTDTALDDIFIDVDGNLLSYEVEEMPENVDVTIEDDTEVTFTPVADWNGVTTVTIIATDGIADAEYDVTITVIAVNDAPSIVSADPDTDVAMSEGESKTFQIVAEDADLDELYYEWYIGGDKQETGQFDTSFTYETDSEDAGLHKVKVKVTDGVLEVIYEWQVTVKNVNNAPQVEIVEPTADVKIKAGKTTLKANVTDIDGDTVKITWYVNGKVIPASNKDTIEYKLKGGKNIIKVTVSDQGGLSGQDEITVQVKPTDTGNTPGFELVALLGAVLVVFFAFRRRR